MKREEPSAQVPARDKQVEEDLWQRHKEPKPVKRVWIDKPGSAEKRPLGIPTVTDRVVRAAVRAVIEPIFEKQFAKHSYGFRPGCGPKACASDTGGKAVVVGGTTNAGPTATS